MKTFLTMTLAVVLGVALTTTISLARMGASFSLTPVSLDLPAEAGDDSAQTSSGSSLPAASTESGEAPLAVAEEEEFDFGRLRNKTMDNRHVFQVRNEGTAPLEFLGATASCNQCTFVDLPKMSVAPGETGEVVVRWNVDVVEDHFRQSATVKTNDPEHESLRFVITGKVVRPLTAEPQKLVFSSVQVNQPAQAKVRLSAYFFDDLKVTRHALPVLSTAKYFEVTTSPVPKDQLDPDARSGVDLTVSIKPGLPIGSITQSLEIETNLPEEPEESRLSIPISGEVVGAVTVLHKDWDREYGYLRIGHVKQSEGAKRTVNLLARGTDLQGLKLDPPEINDPRAVKVTYGEVSEIKQGTVVRVPVTIEIPPGGPLVNHMGGKNAKMAEIVVPTNKSALGRVRLLVRFAVIAD